MLNVKLIVVGGAIEGEVIQLDLPATLGRSRGSSLPLPHPLVSRQHCELVEKDGGLFVRDLGSTNGTFVGSERVDSDTLIEHGGLLTVGTVTFRAQYDDAPLESSDADSRIREVPGHGRSEDSFDTSTITRVDTGRIGTPSRTEPHPREPVKRPAPK